jgi:hypothetical protein
MEKILILFLIITIGFSKKLSNYSDYYKYVCINGVVYIDYNKGLAPYVSPITMKFVRCGDFNKY